jgi:hypothetical protein
MHRRGLCGLMAEHVIFAHGHWFARDAKEALRRLWRWMPS